MTTCSGVMPCVLTHLYQEHCCSSLQTESIILSARFLRPRRMAPHLQEKELDKITTMASFGKTPTEIHQHISKLRGRRGIPEPQVQAIRRALKGRTHRRGCAETRGRKRSWTRANVLTANKIRKELYKKGKGAEEIHWSQIIVKARVPKIDPTTAARSFRRAGLDVAARKPREKPMRSPKHEQERMIVCMKLMEKPNSYFTKTLDLIMDNKHWDCPTSAAAQRYGRMRKVRFHLRTRSEGLKKGYTKPSCKKNRVNPGASLNVCAGIINNKIKIWHYLPKSWCGAAAEALYRGPIIRALRRYRGEKHAYRILEDNDPTGYKSSKGKRAKREPKIEPIHFPPYSPDLNPLDFYIWTAIEARMAKHAVHSKETVGEFKARLRRTALRLPAELIKKAVASIRKRAAAIVEAEGGDISCD